MHPSSAQHLSSRRPGQMAAFCAADDRISWGTVCTPRQLCQRGVAAADGANV